ncbi:hypothetical protein [Novosphingobium sp.]|uniref:hypothetical protein n=1 Tax=Novosphingobium sp. TaxID=1874826 RepID=UPI003BAC2E21
MVERLHARVAAQLKLAMLGDCGCDKTLSKLEREARLSGLTGAEIDAAIGGRSFEARTAAAIAYACALKAGEPEMVLKTRTCALQFGVTEDELAVIGARARQILASRKL